LGNYKKHWDAHVKQEGAKTLMEDALKKDFC
jgi:predicted RNA-binding protein with PUA domain